MTCFLDSCANASAVSVHISCLLLFAGLPNFANGFYWLGWKWCLPLYCCSPAISRRLAIVMIWLQVQLLACVINTVISSHPRFPSDPPESCQLLHLSITHAAQDHTAQARLTSGSQGWTHRVTLPLNLGQHHSEDSTKLYMLTLQ